MFVQNSYMKGQAEHIQCIEKIKDRNRCYDNNSVTSSKINSGTGSVFKYKSLRSLVEAVKKNEEAKERGEEVEENYSQLMHFMRKQTKSSTLQGLS